ncbi:MAG: amino acid adenylation domain-containing protein [Verrucomicrobia bacterium]|nr:amino acid adenylation domain-containing protein [Verrucomicrobiota bacterium]MBS0636244.1 amino acid adenylation domain-containing protein [Verrucomicrobiota bacterium]
MEKLLTAILETHKDKTAFIFLDADGREVQTISFKTLECQAKALASKLVLNGLEGKHVVLFFAPGIEFIVSFLACLYAKVVAVPIPPPHGKRQKERVKQIMADAEAASILTTQTIKRKIEGFYDKWIEYDVEGDLTPLPEVSMDDVAFLQYTSGSTSLPKGVIVTHKNLIANEKSIQEAFGHDANTVVGGWLPFYHDMGLIGNILQPLYLGVPCVLMAPTTFLQNPLLWLKTISRYRITTSGGPNFAYELAVNRIDEEELAGLDLSCWKVAFNGSEPVYSQTMKRFSEKFSRVGFSEKAFYPCYGLAEATLFVTGPKAGSSLVVSRHEAKVSCGFPRNGLQVCIVDPKTLQQVGEGSVGEIWVAGESVAKGYWNMPEVTNQLFHAYTQDGLGPFMRTQDLGFLEGDELFISGRLKNMLILRGKNFYAHDIEHALSESHEKLKKGLFAAISIEHDQQEKLVVVYELDRAAKTDDDFIERIQLIKSALAQDFQIDPYSVLLVRPGTIVRTTSGKIQHHLVKELYLNNALAVVGQSKERSFEGTPLAKILNIAPEELSYDRSLLEHGLDSLKAVQIQSYFKKEHGVALEFDELFEDVPLRALLMHAASAQGTSDTPEVEVSFQGPLSANQQDLWVAYQLDRQSRAYHIPVKMRVKGSFSLLAFRASWKDLMLRHPILRTKITGAHQSVEEHCEPPIELYDAAEYSEEALFEKVVHTPFVLEQAPLFRIAVCKYSDSDWAILYTFHHIITDGWSMGILLKDLAYCYRARVANKMPVFSEVIPSYIQYAKESQRTQSELAKAWVDYLDLGGDFPQLSISNYHRPPKVRSDAGSSVQIALDEPLVALLRSSSREWGATLATLLMAAFHAMLHLYSKEPVVLVGYPSANRSRSAFQNVCGFFVNTLVAKTVQSSSTTFSDLVMQVKRGLSFGVRHDSLAFHNLLDALKPPRIDGISPLFQAMFVMQNAPDDVNIFPGAETALVNAPSYPVIYDLVLEAKERVQDVLLTFEYKTDCLPAWLVEQFSRQYVAMLSSALQSPEQALSSLSWLEQVEALLPAAAQDQSVVDLIRKQALLHPNKPAVLSGESRLTYKELIQRSEAIARHLMAHGVVAESRVGYCLDRSIDVIPTMLGIMMAQGAYVPLDPNYPDERTKMMLEDASVEVIIAHKRYLDSFTYFSGTLVAIDTITPCESLPLKPCPPNQLAYILFTSGSTGRPKGVMVEHHSLYNFAQAACKAFNETEDDVSLQFASLSWDTSSEEIYPCLIAGGTVVHRSSEPVEPFEAILQLTQRHGITIWNFPTSYWHDFTGYLISKDVKLPKTLRLVIIGGEKVFKEKVEQWIALFGTAACLLNTYGATEATSISCATNLALWDQQGSDIPIGFAFDNVRAVVCNEVFREMPVAVSGDLYISGEGVARGYLDATETSKKFLNGFYKTGDTAYKDPSGQFYIKGRSDTQVKRRGYRIELEEIQRALHKVAGVEKALVLLQDEKLVAYVVTSSLSKQLLIEQLRKMLPGYMVPDALVFVEDFPRLGNGKLNLHALKQHVEVEAPVEHTSYSETEAKLLAIWKSLLGHSSIQLEDSFFDVGGNSLKLVSLHQAINDSFGISINIADLFRYHTCSLQAEMCDKELAKNTPQLSELDLLKKLAEGSLSVETVTSLLNKRECYENS